MPLIDAFKAIASQLVVLHHLSAYGPIPEAARALLPNTLNWFYDYARIAVQVFLVVGGFLAARALSGNAQALTRSPFALIWKRYQRLVIPYLVAIGLAMLGAAIADRWMDDEAIPARATLAQWLAHAFLLQSLLDFDSLSAGVWYIAIDFQLFSLMALLLWTGRRRIVAPALVLLVAISSLFWFNRDPAWDNWALYFFGSYGLGAAAWWASERKLLSAWLGVLATVVIAALIVDFRLRIAVALSVALAIGFSRRSGLLERWPDVQPIAFLGRISYSLFLVHFPICLLANALFVKLGLSSPLAASVAILLTWAASIAGGTLFYRWVESPAASQRISLFFGRGIKLLRGA
jgi:peptidoglycan/LPS O-acetylase OafA/YrhL